MGWLDAAERGEFLYRLYEGKSPDLSTVTIQDVVLHPDGPSVLIRMDLQHYPAEPPRKWRIKGCNTVQVTLRAFVVRRWSMDG